MNTEGQCERVKKHRRERNEAVQEPDQGIIEGRCLS